MRNDLDLSPIRLGYFTASVVSTAARLGGHYRRHGLAVTEHPVPSSPEAFGSLLRGEYDLLLSSPDNLLTYRFDPANPLGRTADVRALLAVDGGLGLSVLAAPGIGGAAEIRGGTVAVDSPTSGFAYALYAVLAELGLERDRDYILIRGGSTPRRRDLLVGGGCTATLLGAGHDLAAEAEGCRRLGRVSDVVRPYLGTVLAATGAWLDAHPDLAGAMVAAWREATGSILDPARRDEVLGLVQRAIGTDRMGSAAAYRVLVSEHEGLVRDGRVDPAALTAVLRLRERFGGLPAGLDPAVAGSLGLVDPRFQSRTGPAR
jgi:ABC-type nitrate/sulfonate/bicarbonate transport system substrate-binding protein